MNINATLLVQMIAFGALIWFTMKFVWPPLIGAIDERNQKIADGLAAADKARSDLASANDRIEKELAQTRVESAKRLDDGHDVELWKDTRVVSRLARGCTQMGSPN